MHDRPCSTLSASAFLVWSFLLTIGTIVHVFIGSPTQDKVKAVIQQNSGRDGDDWRADWAGSEREAQRNRIVRINTSDVWGKNVPIEPSETNPGSPGEHSQTTV
ncbi:MAG: hypothetical protein WBO24_14955 [Nitrospirales bacterium]